jgi:hypothetical protein
VQDAFILPEGEKQAVVATGSDFGQMKKFHQATAKDSAQRRTRR